MLHVEPGLGIKKINGNGKKIKFFPVDLRDDEQFLHFVVDYIKLPLLGGACRITIHANGQGLVMHTEEMKVNK